MSDTPERMNELFGLDMPEPPREQPPEREREWLNEDKCTDWIANFMMESQRCPEEVEFIAYLNRTLADQYGTPAEYQSLSKRVRELEEELRQWKDGMKLFTEQKGDQ